MNIDKIRDEKLTEDSKMEMIADYLQEGENVGIETVSLAGLAGTLGDEDYAKVQRNNCIVLVGTQYYYKQYSAATVIRYGAIPRATAQGDGVIFDYVDIDKDTKAYEVKNEEVLVA